MEMTLLSGCGGTLTAPKICAGGFGNNRATLACRSHVFSDSSSYASNKRSSGQFPFVIRTAMIGDYRVAAAGSIGLNSRPTDGAGVLNDENGTVNVAYAGSTPCAVNLTPSGNGRTKSKIVDNANDGGSGIPCRLHSTPNLGKGA